MSGFTHRNDNLLAGTVHPAEHWGPCSCGGRAHYYEAGEVIHHSLPLNKEVEHKVPFGGMKMHLLFDYKLVE